MSDRALLVRSDDGLPVFMRFVDTYTEVSYLHFVDFTNPEAGRYVWDKAKKNYWDRGVRLFWLDECEPEARGTAGDGHAQGVMCVHGVCRVVGVA